MSANKKEKLASLAKDMTEIDQRGLNLFQISYNLNDLGVETLSFEDIVDAISEDPLLRDEVLKSIKKGMKEAGASAKEIKILDAQTGLAEVKFTSLPTTEDSPEIEAAREAVEKAKLAAAQADAAKSAAEAAKIAADAAEAQAKIKEELAIALKGEKEEIAEEARKAAEDAAKEAKRAAQFASEAVMQHKMARGWAAHLKDIAKNAAGVEYDMVDTLQAKYEEKISATAVDDVLTKSNSNFVILEGSKARLAAEMKSPGEYQLMVIRLTYDARVLEMAKEKGLSEDEALALAFNAKTRQKDMHFLYVQSEQNFLAQNYTRDDARKAAEAIVKDQYGVWADRFRGGITGLPSEEEYSSAINTWLTGVVSLKDAAHNFETLDPNDKVEIKGYAQTSADLVRTRALAQGLSESEADALANNAYRTVENGLYFAFESYENFIAQGYSEEEAMELSDKVVIEKYGEWITRFFNEEGGTGTEDEDFIAQVEAVDTFILQVKALKDLANSNYNPIALEEATKASTKTKELLLERALALGMSQKEAEEFAKNGANAVFGIVALATQINQNMRALDPSCDEACWEVRDSIIDKILDNEYLTWFKRLYDPGHDFDKSLIPDVAVMDIYITGVVVTDAREILNIKYEKALKAANWAQKKADEYKQKKAEADKALALAKKYEGDTSAEANEARARAEAAVLAAETALAAAELAAQESDAAKEALMLAQNEYARLKKILDDLIAGSGSGELVFYPKGDPNRPEDWKGKPDLDGIKRLEAQEKAKPIRKMAMGTITGRPRLTAALNGMTDAAVYKLLESGALPSDMVKEYIADGKNPPIKPIDYKEAIRDMEMGTITDNPRLAAAMNGMSDSDVYKLLESGILSTDMVREYIANGANAPIAPCGSNTCEMVPGTYYNGVLYDPNREQNLIAAAYQEAQQDARSKGIKEPSFEDFEKEYKEKVSLEAGVETDDMKKDISELTVGGNLLTDIASGVTKNVAGQIQQDIAEITQILAESGAEIRGASGEVITADEAYSQMPEGGIIQDDGALLPCHAGNVGAEGC